MANQYTTAISDRITSQVLGNKPRDVWGGGGGGQQRRRQHRHQPPRLNKVCHRTHAGGKSQNPLQFQFRNWRTCREQGRILTGCGMFCILSRRGRGGCGRGILLALKYKRRRHACIHLPNFSMALVLRHRDIPWGRIRPVINKQQRQTSKETFLPIEHHRPIRSPSSFIIGIADSFSRSRDRQLFRRSRASQTL
jgi:hypothetical protein